MESARYVLIGTCALLLIPFFGSMVSESWDWNTFDYLVMGTLLFSMGMLYQIITKRMFPNNRLIVGLILACIFALIWAELSVGIFGTPFAGS